ncbi:MAG: hypothetical protein Q8N48_06230 [Thiobacillus sp.]|nr:hypothetical protein [Thiobacillus sp.]MDP2978409.1 hypothetical protein [Thiobacillus sp.]
MKNAWQAPWYRQIAAVITRHVILKGAGTPLFTAASCLGHGLKAALAALRAQKSGLAPRAFETVTGLAAYIGEVAGIDDGPDPEATPQVLDLIDRPQARARLFESAQARSPRTATLPSVLQSAAS